MVDKVQMEQIKVRIQQAMDEKRVLFEEEGLAPKLQLLFQFAIEETGVLAELLQLFRTFKNRDFSHSVDIQALRNMVPYAYKLRDYQSGLRQRVAASVKELDEIQRSFEE